MDYKDNIKLTPAGFLKSMSIIHAALLAGQLLFVIVVFAISPKVYFTVSDTADVFVFIVPLLAIAGFVSGYILFKQKLTELQTKNSLGEKMVAYQAALIIRFALLEGPSLFGVVAFMQTGNLFFLAISALLMLYFFSLRPTKDKMEIDLALGFTEKMEFLNDDEAIKQPGQE
jgi:hypothetical protein